MRELTLSLTDDDLRHLSVLAASCPDGGGADHPALIRQALRIAAASPAAPLVEHPATVPPSGPVEVWTDGACSGNPGPGGWSAIVRAADGSECELSGGEGHTTNNRMELMGAIAALESLGGPRVVTLRSDSRYLIHGMTLWLSGWQARGWRKTGGKPVENRDLWTRLASIAARHRVTWEWVRGHAGDAVNARADALAVLACEASK